jgi:mannose-1-phosphate guanylyltransferase
MYLYPVIMAGGSGTRFWPASRSNRPKQFLNIIGPSSMIQQTMERVRPICSEQDTIIVGSESHHEFLEDISNNDRCVVIEEPLGRNTAPCIGLAAVYLRKKGLVQAPMAVLPADHYIADEERFREVLLAGGRLALKGSIVTIGIVPTRPETGYGYLRRGAVAHEHEGVKAYNVERFVEKPDEETALGYLAGGDYLWNGGIFLFTPETILAEIERHLPDVHEGLLEIESSMGTADYEDVLRSVYKGFPSISIDYGIMEKTGLPVLALAGDFGWSDVGSWHSLYTLRKGEADKDGNLAEGDRILIDTKGSFVFNRSNRMVVALGQVDTVIISTDDVVLVADMARSQDIKKVTEELRERGLTDLL